MSRLNTHPDLTIDSAPHFTERSLKLGVGFWEYYYKMLNFALKVKERGFGP